ncbi:hypothetical protein SKAU_G00411930 [Synaphobranchus kaupii]|uniref:Gypsy retrotransposon integrase-like protein 1 n=1 Tax=Synaphobranchus kaupii TaxID=118154 RepID=A0A9Q1E7X3_SYNKA|nr:hypothetical protein SKAU_G00411930 [Synaphobranchus kaupii]
MGNTGVPTPRMDWDSTNLPDAWRKFRQHIELMFSGPLPAKEEEEKSSYLLLWIGEKGRDIVNTWTLTADQRKVLTTYYDSFEAYVMPKAKPIFALYKFHEEMQGESESFDQFVTELKLLVKDCNYPNSDEMCSLQLKPSATPVVCPPRRIPYALRSRLKEELDEMERMDIIQKVTEPTEWVDALVVVEKPKTGKTHPLNKAIQRPHYPLPTLDDVTPRLAGAQYFSVLDARSGYWTIKLSQESSMLTTFNTVFGRYRFKRLPFGIMSAQDEFQRRIDGTYEGLSGVAVIVDDILVYGRSKEEHDASLCAMLERIRERGIKLNKEKSVICVPEVSYFGHRLTREGIRPDPNKVKAIKEMELETILGMVTYLSRFAPKLSEATAPLHQLLKFDHTKDVKLQVDASTCSLGAVLLQEEKPVAYASKTLNGTKQNYAQIKKELYAVLFGCRRFHQYLYGQQVTIESDHKPLEAIMRKPLAAAPPRLRRMILQLQRYDITIAHNPGKDIPVADTRSRKPIECRDESLSEGMDSQIHTVVSNVAVSDRKMAEIRAATAQDEQLSVLRQVILSGWPESNKQCPPAVADYWNHREEISEIDGILLKGEKIIVPHSLRAGMLSHTHRALGHGKMQTAGERLFWPGMGKQIEALIGSCSICLERRKCNRLQRTIATYYH